VPEIYVPEIYVPEIGTCPTAGRPARAAEEPPMNEPRTTAAAARPAPTAAGSPAPVDLRVTIGSLELRNPVLLASGTCGYGEDIAGLVDVGQLGGIVTKTVTPEPRAGNRPPRIAEVPGGMLNSIGLENVGLEAFVLDKLPVIRRLDTRCVVSIGGESAADYERSARRLEGLDGIDALELNLSCPNVSGGMDLSRDPAACGAAVAAVRAVTERPLVAKLTPNVASMVPIAGAAADAGADAVSLVNTFLGMAIDVERRRPALASVVGGLSGPAIRPLAVARVFEVSRAVGIPVIGIGGIASGRDVVEFLLAGATAVQVGTQNFVDPSGAGRLATALRAYLERHRLRRPAELRQALELPAADGPARGEEAT
jgi:dihydroorotate dehydrogenase (NAD+) catalytic subunit